MGGPTDQFMDRLTYQHSDKVTYMQPKIEVNSGLVEPCLLATSEAVDDLFQHTFRVVACRRV